MFPLDLVQVSMAEDRGKKPSRSITYLLSIFVFRIHLNFCSFVVNPQDSFMCKSLLTMLMFITALNFEPQIFS